MNARYVAMVSETLPNAAAMDLSRPFNELGVDSFDLLALRVQFEREIDREIPDREWTAFETFLDLFGYCDRVAPAGERKAAARPDDAGTIERQLELGMPQMTIGSLSENWLFRELGSAHWEMLCRGLDRKSSELQDEMGNRLYATFARVQVRTTSSIAQFGESEPVRLSGSIARFGNGMYFSNLTLASQRAPENVLTANMITSFSRRSETGNKNLVKSHPHVPANAIENVAKVPDNVDEYRLLKKGEKDAFDVGGHRFTMDDAVLFSTTYTLNPYYDLNGAGLLYFASYPTISDFCELQYCQAQGHPDWAEQYFTAARDILYFANCDLHDSIEYRLHSIEVDGPVAKVAASLRRRSDDTLMARIFTVKHLAAA